MNVSEATPPGDPLGTMAYNYAVVGVQKGGTSTLAVTLNQHRLVCQPPDKERHYFDDETVDWSAPDYARDYSAPRRAPDPPARRRRDAHLPLLAAGARADARLRLRDAAHRGLPRPARAALLALGDAALAQPRLARLAGLPHRVAAHVPARRGAGRRTHDAVAAHDRPGAGVLRRAAAARLRAVRPPAVAAARAAGDAGRLRGHRAPHDRLPRAAALRARAPAAGTGTPARTRSPARRPTADDLARVAEVYAKDLALFEELSDIDTSAWPTRRILDGDLDPGELAARFARKVR